MLPEKTFEGRVGIITGGATGIGFAMAREVARLGGRVVLCSRKEENLGKAVEQIRSETGREDAAAFHVLDVRDADAVEAMVMDYSVRGAKVAELPPDNSRIQAKLHVTDRGYWLTDVKPIP